MTTKTRQPARARTLGDDLGGGEEQGSQSRGVERSADLSNLLAETSPPEWFELVLCGARVLRPLKVLISEL